MALIATVALIAAALAIAPLAATVLAATASFAHAATGLAPPASSPSSTLFVAVSPLSLGHSSHDTATASLIFDLDPRPCLRRAALAAALAAAALRDTVSTHRLSPLLTSFWCSSPVTYIALRHSLGPHYPCVFV